MVAEVRAMGGNDHAGHGAGHGGEDGRRFTSGEWHERESKATEVYIRAREDTARAEARNELLLQQTVTGVQQIQLSLAAVVATNTALKVQADDHAAQLENIWKRLDEGRSSWSSMVPQAVSSLLSAAILAGAVATAIVMTKPADPPAHTVSTSSSSKPG